MKKIYFKGLAVRLTLFSVLVGAVFIIHSCRKESKLGSQALTDSVNMVKTWYETTYPVNTGNSSSLSTSSVSSGGLYDYSQHIKPDWAHSVSYRRLGKSVIEIPMDPSNKIQIALKNNNNGAIVYTKENTKTSFIILNDGKTNQAFVMTIMANGSYIAGDPAKLAKNTYRHRDANFTGLVVYSTPKGKFVRAYAYNNGILLAPSGTSANAASLKTQGLVTLSPCDIADNVHTKTNSTKQVNNYWACTDWYQVIIADGNITEQYLDTICSLCADGGGSPGGPSSDPGTSPSDPGSGGTTPNPCSTPTNPTDPTDPGNGGGVPVNQNSVQHLAVNDVGDGGDGGMGDPTVCTSPITIVNNVVNPCLKSMVNKVINANITTVINGIIQNVFGGSSTINLAYTDAMALNPGVEGYTPPTALDANGNLNLVIYLNASPTELPHYSQEFVATVIMHESLHAYLTTIGSLGSYQHEAIMTVFVTQMATDLKQMFPNLSDADAKNLALGGLSATTGFKDQIASDMNLLGSYAATQLAYSVGPSGTRCN